MFVRSKKLNTHEVVTRRMRRFSCGVLVYPCEVARLVPTDSLPSYLCKLELEMSPDEDVLGWWTLVSPVLCSSQDPGLRTEVVPSGPERGHEGPRGQHHLPTASTARPPCRGQSHCTLGIDRDMNNDFSVSSKHFGARDFFMNDHVKCYK